MYKYLKTRLSNELVLERKKFFCNSTNKTDYLSKIYLVGESRCDLNLFSFGIPFRTGVVGIELTWCANFVPSKRLILRKASARVAFKHTSSSPCSRTRLSKSDTRTTTPRLSASSISSVSNKAFNKFDALVFRYSYTVAEKKRP